MKAIAAKMLAVFVALAAYAAGAYEVVFDAGSNANASVVHKIPISRNLQGVVERGNVLETASILPERLTLRDINGLGAATLQFKDGRLVRFQRDGDETDKGKDDEFLSVNLASPVKLPMLWRKISDGDEGYWKYWDKSSRIRLWFFNPNGAGMLFAEISLGLFVLGALVLRRRMLRLVLIAASIVPAVFLLMTGSRGSLIALVAGLMASGLFALRELGAKRAALVVVAALLAVAAAVACLGGDRFGRNLFAVDGGNVQRLRAWRAAPAMIAAAPDGWGEKPGRAYCEWFQTEDDTHFLEYLVNTHLTWMAGKGWVFSFLYVFGWVLLFALLLSRPGRYCAAALAMWTMFFVANWFSTLGIFASLWVIPAVLTIPAVAELAVNFKTCRRRWLIAVAASLATASGVVCGVIAVGKSDLAKMDVPVRKAGNAVFAGNGKPAAYVVPDLWVLCRYNIGGMGRDIRAWCKAHPAEGSVAVAESIDELPKKAERIVLVGRSCREFMSRVRKSVKDKTLFAALPKAKDVVFVSPNLAIRKIPERLLRLLRVRVLTGEFLAEVAGDLDLKRPRLKIVSGCELYLPDWMELSMNRGEE